MVGEKKKKFYSGRYDIVFKEIMSKDGNEDLLIAILETCLNVKIKKIVIKNSEQNNRNIFIRRKILDLLLETNIGLIDIEVNNGTPDYLHNRNLAFLSNVYSSYTLRGEEYDLTTKIISLNLTYGMSKNEELKNREIIDIYRVSNNKNECYVENFLIYEINMDKVLKFWYSRDEKKIEEFKYLIMLGLDKNELLLFSKDRESVKKYMENIIELNKDPRFIEYMTREEDQRKCYNTDLNLARKKGLKEGAKQNAIETAKIMLKDCEKVEKIMKYTNLSIEEIEKLKKEK